MGKSSHKKKRSKHSSQVRSRKKSGKPKSKKLRRPSLSSSEESEYSSYESDWSSGEDYRRRRKNRGLRSKKRVRGRSPSSRSSASEDEVRVKRRKRSKRKEDYSARRKAYKKKSRRSPSVSLMKCSNYSESSSSGESDFERSRGRSGRKDKGKRDLEKGSSRIRRGRDRDRDRSRSGFSPSLSREGSGPSSEERVMTENCSRRLRSVIIIAEGGKNVELGEEGSKDEIMYDQGDYPSCRSNDSIDGGNRKEYAIDLQSEKWQVENDDITSSKFGQVDDIDGQGNDYGTGKSGPLKGDKDIPCADTDRQKVDDLETMLRQRALENLLKFRGGLKNNVNTSNEKNERNDGNIQHSSSKGADFIEVESPKEESAGVVGSEVVDTMPVLERDDVVPPPNDEKRKIESDSGKNIDSSMQDPSCTVDQGTSKTNETVNIIASAATCKPKPATVAQNGLARTHISSERAPASQKVHREEIVTAESVRNIAAKNATGSTINDAEELQNASKSVDPGSSHIEPPSREPHPHKLQDQAKEGAQYEQKTMSVMRGGEMVQVSYKVYIPKKPPALAKRKLKR